MATFAYGLESLNLDCMTLTDTREAAQHLRNMARYAEIKAEAMAHRASGNLRKAAAIEVTAEEIYHALPENWRW